MPDLFWIADLGRASIAAFWMPITAWTAVALIVEAALRLGRTRAALALPVRGALLAALPLAVAVPMALSALAPEDAQTVAALAPVRMWLPEVAVGAAPEPVIAAGPPALDVLLGLAVGLVLLAGGLGVLRLGWALVLVGRTRQSLAPAGVEAQAAIDDARRQFGVTRPVVAAVAPGGAAPFTLGWRRPMVALPGGLDGESRRVAALHEVAHVRRSDFAWHTAQRAVQAVFAAHPLVWTLGRGLDLGREQAADAAVLDACPGARRTYADLLLSYASLPAPALALGAVRGSSPLKSRIDAMTRPLSPARSRQLARLGRLVGLVAVVLVAGLAATTAPARPSMPIAHASPADSLLLGFQLSEEGDGFALDIRLRDGATSSDAESVAAQVGDDHGPSISTRLRVFSTDRLLLERRVRFPAGGLTLGRFPIGRLPDGAQSRRPVEAVAVRDTTDEIFDVVDDMPVLIGGLEGLMERVVYPQSAKDDGAEGIVIVQFVIEKDGRVEEAEVRRSPDARLSAAALAAVRASQFEPGRQRGQAVRVRFAVPVMFRLNETPSSAPLPASDADGDGIFEVVDEQPVLIGGMTGLQARVVYPQSAKDDGVEGQVILQFIVNEEGAVEDARVMRSPDERLSEAALEAVRTSRFEPGRQRGRAVKVRFAVPITFRLPAGERTEQGSNWGDDGVRISYDIAYSDGLGAFLDQRASTNQRSRAQVMAHVAFDASPFQDLTPGTARLQFRVQDNGRMQILGDVEAATDALSRYARFLALGAQFRSEAAGRSGTMTLTVSRVS